LTASPTDTSGLGYLVKREMIAVAGGADLQIRSLLDKQQWHDPLGVASALGVSSASWPLFGLLWPSAQKMADLMQTWPLHNLRILEIGCGLALASLVIHRRLGNITASDCHPYTQRFLSANLLLNALPMMAYQSGHWGRDNPLLGEFDLIIGSDVLYERDHPAQLADFIQRHAAQHAQVLIIDPNRGQRSAFNKCMSGHQFDLTQSEIVLPLHDLTPYRGSLLNYQRN
jgi:2-polyprenyl-3-methyl-5-hydroxy-6-metoxy-1,4-benzoquinol methylase